MKNPYEATAVIELMPPDLCKRCSGSKEIRMTWEEFKIWANEFIDHDDPKRICKMWRLKHRLYDTGTRIACTVCNGEGHV